MGIEKYFMAIFMHRGKLPRNHTMTDLLEEAKSFLPIRPDLEKTLRYMDSLQRICSMDDFEIRAPEKSDVPRFIEATTMVAELAGKELGRDVLHF
jgi:HEPN domain-containing protein